MPRYVAFLRAINVAGHASLSMGTVREAFEAAGCEGVRTVIQSGNVIFEAAGPEASTLVGGVRSGLRRRVGKEVTLVLRRAEEVADLVRARPFDRFGKEVDIKCYVCFLSRAPPSGPGVPMRSEREALEVVGLTGCEAFVVSRRIKGKAIYGFPNYFVEKALGVAATTRNWSTVVRIADLLSEPGTAEARTGKGRRP